MPVRLTTNAILVFLGFCFCVSCSSSQTLDIYFIDTEGGAATLIVSPSGESLLADSGNPGKRDAGRIAHIAKNVAGLTSIDHCLSTHWHNDHYGGVTLLNAQIPIKKFYDRGLPKKLRSDHNPELIASYINTTGGKSITLEPGDVIPLQAHGTPLEVKVLAASGVVLGEEAGAQPIRRCSIHKAALLDESDNALSVTFLLKFGDFEFFDGGDITWNIEHKLACPKNLAGEIDVYQVTHHGLDSSNNPTLVHAMAPRVAIANNGPRKGVQPKTFAALKSSPGIEAIYQVHRNLVVADDNPDSKFIANDNDTAECKAQYVQLSVAADGKSYTVTVPSKGTTRKHTVKSE